MNTQTLDMDRTFEISKPISGQPLVIGTGFKASSFKQGRFDGLMDPLVMVDHFTMTEPTFGAHPHAGMSAVSILFEDSKGLFHNRDSLGNDFDIAPGDLYWLKAGAGAVHDEAPRPGARIHALQVFVNLPARHKADAPASLHIPAGEMPIIESPKHRARVILGESNGVEGARSPALPLTILDISLGQHGDFTHDLPASQSVWLLAVRGDAEIQIQQASAVLAEGEAMALRTGSEATSILIQSEAGAQIVLIHGEPVNEPFVQRGPFVMNTMTEIETVEAAYAAGELGSID